MPKAMLGSITALAAVIAIVPAAAQAPGSRQTREFLQGTAQSDQFEILEGQVILAQSTDPDVRAFAAQMVRDHGGTSRALTEAAARTGLQTPEPGIGDDQARLLGALQGLRGKDLDRAYLRQQVPAHRSALAVQQAYAASGDALAVRQAAASAIPLISSHLTMAEQMLARMNASN